MVTENNDLTCECFCFDVEKVNRIKKDVTATEGMARFFKALGDETRIKIIYSLSQEELCVCDMAQIIGISVAAVSHHLRLLKNMGLAKSRKQGKMVFYSLADPCIKIIINTALKHQNSEHDGYTLSK
ncbi:MAG: ArsR family transcriptional regulator [Peptococcaceae bacterium BRH_c8a]|nr:MAG: ArsR family transcriptional regulator [Peptococcaceae bacterium BRH_c8a]